MTLGKMSNIRFLLTLVILFSLAFQVQAEDKDDITIFAASSLIGPLGELASVWEKAGNPSARLVYGPSATLARQITFGAPVDVFISANPNWTHFVKEKLGTRESEVLLVTNQLTLVANIQSEIKKAPTPLTKEWLGQLLETRRLAIANPETAPAGVYAKEYLIKLGIWQSLEGKLAYGASVRQALLYSERSDMLALVYKTDAAASKHVKTLADIPIEMSGEISYAALNIKGRPLGQEFIQFLRGSTSAQIWTKHGFGKVE
jgi:molybdate transport system substrate-binding protein